jgi:GDP-L-fucose synthase
VCAYPKHCPVPFREQDIWNGYPEETNAPYGIAKKSLFVMLEAYHNQYGLNGIILIPSNLYGPGDSFNPASSHVIPAIIKKISKAIQNNEQNIEIWGDGSATREFLYAPEAARAIVATVQKQTGFELINIGSGEEISIRLLVSKIAHIMNYKGDILWDTSKPNGQPRRCVDTSKAQKLLQWSNNIDIDQGLADTIKWYLSTQ